MTSITHSPAAKPHRAGHRAFTLTELLVGMALAGLLMVGVLSSVLFFQRSAMRIAGYQDMDVEARKALEVFGRDARMAADVNWISATCINLTIPSATGLETYRYEYDSTKKSLMRSRLSPTTTPATAVVSGIDSFSLTGFMITGVAVDLTDLTLASKNTKQLQLTLVSTRTPATVARATNNVISARFILRNKRVTA